MRGLIVMIMWLSPNQVRSFIGSTGFMKKNYFPTCSFEARIIAPRFISSKSTKLYTSGKNEVCVNEAIRQYTVDGSPRALKIAERMYKKASISSLSSQQEHSRKSLLESSPVLVLNSDYQPLSYTPLSVWSWQETAKAVFSGRVVVVAEYDGERIIRSPNSKMRLPSVIALREYRKRNMSPQPHFTRRNVYIRDMFKCQYCAKHFRPLQLTYDHVIPRSKGGPTSWDNVVTCCFSCNNRKGNLSTKQFAQRPGGFKLLKQPYTPSHDELTSKAMRLPLYRQYHETWGNFVVQLNIEKTDHSSAIQNEHE
mmetsp:Transcript_512/g.661  ORF Transcript_512/g.661 Transcript_512/m.661 type:complete len:309 (+) Transcript_512:98-1024(+)